VAAPPAARPAAPEPAAPAPVRDAAPPPRPAAPTAPTAPTAALAAPASGAGWTTQRWIVSIVLVVAAAVFLAVAVWFVVR